MYYYIYDTFLNSAKYQKAVTRIENRLVDLGLTGKSVQLSLLKSLKELVEDEYAAGMRNFIAIGNDKTLLNLINITADLDVTIGYIPVGSDNHLAKVLGILPDELACDILSARIIKNIDLGKINHCYFLTLVKIQASDCIIECDGQYRVSPLKGNSSIEIINLNDHTLLPSIAKKVNAQDGFLNIVIQHPSRPEKSFVRLFKKSNSTVSFFTVKNISIKKGQDAKAVVDGFRTVKLPLEISIHSNKLRMVVGKQRSVLL